MLRFVALFIGAEKRDCLSAGAYTTTLYVKVDGVKEGGRAPPTLTRLG